MGGSSRLKYVANNTVYDTAFDAFENSNNIFFSLGKKLDNYEFRRFPVDQNEVDKLLFKRLTSLREKYDYIRLWFGGGADCRIILDCAIKFNIRIDEIIIVRRCCKNNLNLYKDFNPLIEIDSIGVNYIISIKNLIPETKINIIDFDDRELELVYQNPDWYKFTPEWFFGNAYLPRFFLKFVNNELNYINYQKNSCDLLGSTTPNIFFSQESTSWKFCFSDRSFGTVSSLIDDFSIQEDFLVSDDFPEILETHVNSIIDNLDQQIILSSEWNSNPRQFERFVKSKSLFYKNFQICNGHQFDKNDLELEFPSKDFFWRVGQSQRSFYEIINRFYQKPIPKCLDYYINRTNWSAIKNQREKGYILTKIWSIKG
jgi:hypothetical protein